MNKTALRDRYLNDAVTTVSPAKLVTMLYDRLARDLATAEHALVTGNFDVASAQLLHAQEIVMELRTGLDPTAWEGGPGLASLYAFLLTELISANVKKDSAKVGECRRLVDPLRDAWHQALAQITSQSWPATT
ncbi:MAG: flagellar export chaperone FliS [Acidimicrobiales bacterium]